MSGVSIQTGASRTAGLVVPAPDKSLGVRDQGMLGIEILGIYLAATRSMRRRDLPSTLAALRADRRVTAPVDRPFAVGRRLAHATLRTLTPLPTDPKCLARSLVLSALLARRGIEGSLVIGVRPKGDEPFLAHAWVEHDGRLLLPDEGYVRLHEL